MMPRGTVVKGLSEDLTPEPPVIERIYHPFGKGQLTTTGAQYTSPAPAGIGATYQSVEEAIIPIPKGYRLIELEMSIMGRTKSSGNTDAINYKVQGSDVGGAWDDLCAEQTRAADASSQTDFTNALSGRVDLDGGNAMKGDREAIHLRLVAKSAGSTNTVTAEAKNSSYVLCVFQKQ